MALYQGPITISARPYFNETVEVLRTGMMITVRRVGLCQRFYAGNAPSQACARLKQVCQRQSGLET